MPTTPSDPLVWEVELDRLDLELIRAQRLMNALAPVESPEWRPPSLVGPMPEHLVPRAREILERQASMLTEIVHALHRTQRQRRFADHAGLSAASGPVYVDVSA